MLLLLRIDRSNAGSTTYVLDEQGYPRVEVPHVPLQDKVLL